MEAFLARDPNLKATAQRAFVAYAKSVFLMKNKDVFDVQALDTDKYAHSLGLAVSPRIRFLERHIKQKNQSTKKPQTIKGPTNNKIKFDSDDDDDNTDKNEQSETEEVDEVEEAGEIGEAEDDEEDSEAETQNISNNNVGKTSFQPKKSAFEVSDESENEDNLFTVKRKDHDIEDPLSDSEIVDFTRQPKNKKAVTKAAIAKKILKKKILPNKKTVFDDEGEKVYTEKDKRSELAQKYEEADEGGIDIETAKLVLKEEDKFDKQRFRDKIKAKHKEEKRKLKEQKRKEQEEHDDFGSESEAEEPDLSWLPDPNKIYDKNDEDDDIDKYETYEDFVKNKKSDDDVEIKT